MTNFTKSWEACIHLLPSAAKDYRKTGVVPEWFVNKLNDKMYELNYGHKFGEYDS